MYGSVGSLTSVAAAGATKLAATTPTGAALLGGCLYLWLRARDVDPPPRSSPLREAAP